MSECPTCGTCGDHKVHMIKNGKKMTVRYECVACGKSFNESEL